MTRKVISLFIVVFLANSVFGQCGYGYRNYSYYRGCGYNYRGCGYRSCDYYDDDYYPVHRTRKVPVAVPVLVPSTVFQYAPATAGLAPTLAPNVGYPSFAAPPVQSVGAYPQQMPQQMPQQQAPSDLDARIEAIINAKLDKLMQQQAPQDSDQQQDDGPPALTPGNGNTEASPVSMQNSDLDTRVANMLAGKTCITCHTQGVKVSGGVTLFSQNANGLTFNPSVSKEVIYNAVKPPPFMPPTAKRDPNHPDAIKGADLQLLKAWKDNR